MSNPWEETEAWDNESQWLNWVRGQLRNMWSDYPVRKNFKDETLRPVTKEERAAKTFHPSTKNVGQCVFCKEWFPGSRLEVDHKIPSDGCTTREKAEQFLWYCAAASKEEMQLTCKPCHKIKTYSEREGISFEQAKATKQAIAIVKEKNDKLWLEERGIVPASNQKSRREQIIEELMR